MRIPLARILEARDKSRDLYSINRETAYLRHEALQERAQHKAEKRISELFIMVLCVFVLIGGRMGFVSLGHATANNDSTLVEKHTRSRADIVDRNGRVLATNFETHAVYAQPHDLINPTNAVAKLVEIFPELDHERLLRDFTGKRKFVWIKRNISPEQKQAVHDLGEPGLMFGPRKMRVYPNGHLAAHILGGTTYGEEGVNGAELIGVAGVEKYFDNELNNTGENDGPLKLSLDLTIQDATERVLSGGKNLMNAAGATAVLMDVHTGEVIALASLPDFDPNNRPLPPNPTEKKSSESVLFNRAAQGVYELGSAFKIFAAAQAMDLGIVTDESIVDASAPMKIGRFTIKEFRNRDYGHISVSNVIVKSSNRGAARLALSIGHEKQRDFFKQIGMLDPAPLEIIEATGSQPLFPRNWTKTAAMTIAYGHGISTTPVHLAAGYAAIANGGYYIKPTIVKRSERIQRQRVLSAQSAAAAMTMLRKVVTHGTASFAKVAGYSIAGKTGTADKPKANSGYHKDKVISTFAAVFPADQPKYVLVVSLDEPVDRSGKEPRRTAGWTAVPVAAELVGRVAPLLGLRPQFKVAAVSQTDLNSH